MRQSYFEHGSSWYESGKVAMPLRFQKYFRCHKIKAIYITKGLNGCLFLFSEDEWISSKLKLLSLPFTKLEAKKICEMFFDVKVTRLDRYDTIPISKDLVRFARLDKEVVIARASNRLEIWDKTSWGKI